MPRPAGNPDSAHALTRQGAQLAYWWGVKEKGIGWHCVVLAESPAAAP
ncbi:hypothetical protein I541_5583 [Mycobacteroides abscessus]|nr:hypothetical protein I541_5583 [Mycobacteroides abscessus]